jgi:hypothetical protein
MNNLILDDFLNCLCPVACPIVLAISYPVSSLLDICPLAASLCRVQHRVCLKVIMELHHHLMHSTACRYLMKSSSSSSQPIIASPILSNRYTFTALAKHHCLVQDISSKQTLLQQKAGCSSSSGGTETMGGGFDTQLVPRWGKFSPLEILLNLCTYTRISRCSIFHKHVCVFRCECCYIVHRLWCLR